MSRRARLLAAGSLTLLLSFGLLASPGAAELREPQIIDAATGEDAFALGASVGERGAWAAFIQETGGANRLYVAEAQDAAFGPPVLADRGNPVEFAGLVGNERGDAVLAFTEVVNNFDVVFARRLQDGDVGPVQQVSPDGEDAEFGNLMFPFDREFPLAMNAAGAVVLCYQAGAKSFAAILPAGGETWSTRELPFGCFSPGIDSRGNVVALGTDANNALVATRLVGGQLSTDVVEPDAMDQTNLAVGPGGTALATGRDNGFHVFARRKLDIAQDGDWERVGGNVEENLIEGANSSPEDPFSVLDAQGNGLLVFRDNRMVDPNDPDNNPLGYFRTVTSGMPGEGGVLGETGGRIRLAHDALGTMLTSYPSLDFDSAFLRELAGGVAGPETPLAPGLEPYIHPNIAGFVASANGNLLALVEPEGPPRRVAAVFDFTPPDTSLALEVDARRKQRVNRLAIRVICPEEPCEVRATGKAIAKAKRGKSSGATAAGKRTKSFKLKPAKRSLAAGERHKLRLKFKRHRKTVRKLTRLIKRGAKAKAKIKVSASDAAGNVARERLTVVAIGHRADVYRRR